MTTVLPAAPPRRPVVSRSHLALRRLVEVRASTPTCPPATVLRLVTEDDSPRT